MNNTRNKQKPPFLFLLIFIVIGLYFIFIGMFPIEIKIEHFNNKSEAQIHRKSMISPFSDIDITVTNLKQAVLVTSRSSKGGITYRVELESYNGKRTPVTTYYSSGYTFKQNLQNRINESIKTKKAFSYIIHQYGFIIFGFIFCFIPLLIMFLLIKQKNKQNITLKQPQQNRQAQYSLQESTQSEEEKYKNINDLIIK